MASNVIGQVVGNYRLVEKIGDGGMGTVYLAKHVLTQLPVAVKVLHAHHLDDDEYVARFFNEARAAMQIQHPAIVRMFDCGTHGDGSAYLVMEYLDGEDLSKRLKGGRRVPVATAMLIGRQVAQALEAAHEQGVVHRDLKPDNLFMVPDADVLGGERVKILDFGIAKLVHDTQSLHKTRTGSVLGTPTYMSPEQCKGTGNVDHRADLYSLGCILFRLMCGRIVFRSKGYGELIAMHIHMPPPRPTTLEPSIPPLFEDIILTLLAKEPSQRFQSATELLAVMDDAVANTHLGLPPPETWAPMDLPADTDPGVPRVRRAATDDETKLYTPADSQRGSGRDVTGQRGEKRISVQELADEAVRELGHDYDAMAPAAQDHGIEQVDEIDVMDELDEVDSSMIEGEKSPSSTTLRSATGDVSDTGEGDEPGRGRLWLWALLVALVAVGAAVFVVVFLDAGPRLQRYLGNEPVDDRAVDIDETEPRREPGSKHDTPPPQREPDTPPPQRELDTPPPDEAVDSDSRRVTLTVESTPAGAAVIRQSDGMKLGVTPYTTTLLPADEALVVTLRLEGHEDAIITMPADRSSTRQVTLTPRE